MLWLCRRVLITVSHRTCALYVLQLTRRCITYGVVFQRAIDAIGKQRICTTHEQKREQLTTVGRHGFETLRAKYQSMAVYSVRRDLPYSPHFNRNCREAESTHVPQPMNVGCAVELWRDDDTTMRTQP